jgi:molecular chaperone GrpE
MVEPDKKKLNQHVTDDKPEENENQSSDDETVLGNFDISEDELGMGDDYIASALASLEHYPDLPVLDNQLKTDSNKTETITDETPESDTSFDQQKFAVMQARIAELEKTVMNIRKQTKKKLETQGQVLRETKQLLRSLRERYEELDNARIKAVEESEEHKRKWQETVASYINYQKQSKKKLAEFVEMEKTNIIRKFLPVIDDLRRPLDYDKPSESLLEGVKLIYRHCQNFIESLDVKPIPALGEPFDPFYHEAINRIPVDDGPSNVVIEELQVGYLIGDKVLRPAKVSVSYRPGEERSMEKTGMEDTEPEKSEPETVEDLSVEDTQDKQDIAKMSN